MHAAFQRAIFILLLGILPLQSMAAALLPLTCGPVSAPASVAHDHATAAASHHHAADRADHQHNGDQQTQDEHGHLCCHQFSAVPAMHFLAAPQDFHVYASAPARLTPLHIPDLPQRPPRI